MSRPTCERDGHLWTASGKCVACKKERVITVLPVDPREFFKRWDGMRSEVERFIREREHYEKRIAELERELHRWQHGHQVEGDYMCAAEAKLAEVTKVIHTRIGIATTINDSCAISELRRLLKDLQLPQPEDGP